MECLSIGHTWGFAANPLLSRWNEGDYSDDFQTYDHMCLLPVVIPILDEYEQFPTDSDDSRRSGYSLQNDHPGEGHEQDRDARAYYENSDLDEEREDQPRMSEELLRCRDTTLHQLGHYGKGPTEQMWGKGNDEPLPPEGSSSRGSCPRLPRPQLWTVSERDESIGSQASAFNDPRRCSSGAFVAAEEQQDQYHSICEEDMIVVRAISDLTSPEETTVSVKGASIPQSSSPSLLSLRHHKPNDVKKKLMPRPLLGASLSERCTTKRRDSLFREASVSTVSDQPYDAHDESLGDEVQACRTSRLKKARKKLKQRIHRRISSRGST